MLLTRRLHGAAPLLFGIADNADLNVNLSATERPVPTLRIVCSVVTKLLGTRSHADTKCFRKASQGVFRGWWRWACRKTPCEAFRKHFVSAWLRVPRSFVTTEQTIRSVGTGRSVADRFTFKSALSAIPKRSGAAPWRRRVSSIRAFRALPFY